MLQTALQLMLRSTVIMLVASLPQCSKSDQLVLVTSARCGLRPVAANGVVLERHRARLAVAVDRWQDRVRALDLAH